MTNETRYKKYLADILYQDALRTSKAVFLRGAI